MYQVARDLRTSCRKAHEARRLFHEPHRDFRERSPLTSRVKCLSERLPLSSSPHPCKRASSSRSRPLSSMLDRQPGASQWATAPSSKTRTQKARFASPSSSPAAARTRDELVKSNLRLVKRLARKFQVCSVSQDDLLRAGYLGLLKAAANFDQKNDAEFAPFATQWILGEIKHHLRDSSWHLKVSRTLKEDRHRLGKATQALTGSLGRSPTVPELARELETTDERVIELTELSGAATPASLDGSLPCGDGRLDHGVS